MIRFTVIVRMREYLVIREIVESSLSLGCKNVFETSPENVKVFSLRTKEPGCYGLVLSAWICRNFVRHVELYTGV